MKPLMFNTERLEPLGNVQVLRVKVEEDEQLGFVSDPGTRSGENVSESVTEEGG